MEFDEINFEVKFNKIYEELKGSIQLYESEYGYSLESLYDSLQELEEIKEMYEEAKQIANDRESELLEEINDLKNGLTILDEKISPVDSILSDAIQDVIDKNIDQLRTYEFKRFIKGKVLGANILFDKMTDYLEISFDNIKPLPDEISSISKAENETWYLLKTENTNE